MGDNGENVADRTLRAHYDENNLATWDNVANYWDRSLGNGNDMYRECLLPTIEELGAPQKGERVLDLGTGSAVTSAVLAASGVCVTAVDGSKSMLDKAAIRAKEAKLDIAFEVVDLLDIASLDDFSRRHPRFDLITCSMTLKELPDLEPLAAALPRLLAPGGRQENIPPLNT